MPGSGPNTARPYLAAMLSLVLALFLGSGAVSLLSDSLFATAGRQDLAVAAGIGTLLMVLTGVLTLGLMAFVPAIPKRHFLPLALYLPVVGVGILPLFVYFSDHAGWIMWGVSCGQVLLGLFILRRLRGGMKFQWPLVPVEKLAGRNFSWGNLAGVSLAVCLLLVPALALYTGFSAKLAIEHFTDGFVMVRPEGVAMQMRTYVRDDGRKITLVPMSHVGDPDFYQELGESFPDDAAVLMEGVTDTDHLVEVHSDYSKMATSIGGVEQVKVFKPRGQIVPADVDMNTFSPETIGLLNTVMLLHAKGVTPETLPILMKPTSPDLQKRLMDDILVKRNHHLLAVVREQLKTREKLIVPWGAAHMPEISREIQKDGFRLEETREFIAIRLGR